MKKKILTTILAVLLLVAIVVPTMASPYYADIIANSGVLPEEGGSIADGDDVPYAPRAPLGAPKTFFAESDIKKQTSISWANTDTISVSSNDNTGEKSVFELEINSVQTSDDYYYKNLRLRIYLEPSREGIIDWSENATSSTNISFEMLGLSKTKSPTKHPTQGFIEYEIGDLFNDIYKLSGEVIPVFAKGVTNPSDIITAELQVWFEDPSGTLKKLDYDYENTKDNKESKKYQAQSVINWVADAKATPITTTSIRNTLEREATQDDTEYEFTLTTKNSNNGGKGDLNARSIVFSGDLLLPEGVTNTNFVNDVSLTLNGKSLSYYGTAIEGLFLELKGENIRYSFKYNFNSSGTSTSNMPECNVVLAVKNLTIAGLQEILFELQFTGGVSVQPIGVSAKLDLNNKKATVHVTRPGLTKDVDRDLLNSMKISKNVAAFNADGTSAGHVTTEKCAQPFAKDSSIFYDITTLQWNENYEVKNLIIWDYMQTNFLVADSIRVGSYQNALGASVGATAVYIIVIGTIYKWEFTAPKNVNQVLSIAEIIANSSAPSGTQAKNITAMGVGFGDVQGGFKAEDATSYIRFGFKVNPNGEYVSAVEEQRCMLNDARMTFTYKKDTGAEQTYDVKESNTQAFIEENEEGVLKLEKKASKTSNVTYDDALKYTITIKNISEPAKKVNVGVVKDEIEDGLSSIEFVEVSSIKLMNGALSLSLPSSWDKIGTFNYTTFDAVTGTLTWDFSESLYGFDYVLLGGHSIEISYEYRVKSFVEHNGAPLAEKIKNSVTLAGLGTQVENKTVSVGPRPIIFYSIDANVAGEAVTGFDPQTPAKEVNYTMVVKNTQNKTHGSVDLFAMKFDLDMPNGFALGDSADPDVTTLSFARTGRAFSAIASSESTTGSTVKVEYTSDGIKFCVVTYTKGTVNGVDRWSVSIVFPETTQPILKTKDALTDIGTEEELTLTWKAKTPTSNLAFSRSVVYDFFDTQVTLSDVKGKVNSVSTVFDPTDKMKDTTKDKYFAAIIATHVFNNNTTKTVTAKTIGKTRVLTIPMIGKCGTVNDVTMTTSIARASGYPVKYNAGKMHGSIAPGARIYVGQEADITVTIKNAAGSTFSPQDRTIFVHLPIGLTANEGDTITATRSQNYKKDATLFYAPPSYPTTDSRNSDISGTVASVTKLDTSAATAAESASLVEIVFNDDLALTSFFGEQNVSLSGNQVKWKQTATAAFKIHVAVEETFVSAGKMVTSAAAAVTAIIPFKTTEPADKALAENTYIKGKNVASDTSFKVPEYLKTSGFSHGYTEAKSTLAYRMLHWVSLESAFDNGGVENLTQGSQVKWTLSLEHNSTNGRMGKDGFVVFTVPKYMRVTSVSAPSRFAPVHQSAAQAPEYNASDSIDTTANYDFTLNSSNYDPELETLYVYKNAANWDTTKLVFTISAQVLILDYEDIKYYGDRYFNASFVPANEDQAQVVATATDLTVTAKVLDATKCTIKEDTKAEAPNIFKALVSSIKNDYDTKPLRSINSNAKGSVWGGLKAVMYTAIQTESGKSAQSNMLAEKRYIEKVKLGSKITYSFSVQNSSMGTGVQSFKYDNLVVINRLPGVGDLAVARPDTGWGRGSAFSPLFDLDENGKPQVTVWDYDLSNTNYMDDPESCRQEYTGEWSALYTNNINATTGAFSAADWGYQNAAGMGWSASLPDYTKATAIKINAKSVASQHKLVFEVKMKVPEEIDFTKYIDTRLAANPTDYPTLTKDFVSANSFGVAMTLNGQQHVNANRSPAADTNFVSYSVEDPENAWVNIDNIVKNCMKKDITDPFSKNNNFTLTVKDIWRNTTSTHEFTYDAATKKYESLKPGSWSVGQYEIVEIKYNNHNTTTLEGLFDIVIKQKDDDLEDPSKGTIAREITLDSYVMRTDNLALEKPVDKLTFIHTQKEATLRIDTTLEPPTISIGDFTPGDTDLQKYVLTYPIAPGRGEGTITNPETKVMRNSAVDYDKLTWGTDDEFSLTFDLPYGWKPDRFHHPGYVKVSESEAQGYSRFTIKIKLTTPFVRANGSVNLAHSFSIKSVMQSGAVHILKSWNGYPRPIADTITEFHVIANGFGIEKNEKFEYIAGKTGAEMRMADEPVNQIASYVLHNLKKGYYELYEVCYGYEPERLNEGRWVYWTSVEREINGEKVDAGVYKYVGNDGKEASIYIEDEQTWLTGCYNYRYEKPEEESVVSRKYYENKDPDISSNASILPEDNSTSDIKIIPVIGSSGNSSWSLVSLVLSIVAAAASFFLFFSFFKKKDSEDEELYDTGEDVKGTPLVVFMRILAIVLGFGVGVLFLILDDLTLPMTFINQWTLLISIVFAAHFIFTSIYLAVKKREERAAQEPIEEVYTQADKMHVN